jgi:hypothetical protein
MPRPVLEGALAPADLYQNARYDAGYRMGWRDSHRKSRPSHKATRLKYERYAVGIAHGWEDGKAYPDLPEWPDDWQTSRKP